MPPSSRWTSLRNRSRSVRDRRISAVGDRLGRVERRPYRRRRAASGSSRLTATYSLSPSVIVRMLVAPDEPAELRVEPRRQRRRLDAAADGERDLAVRERLEARGRLLVQAEPDAERAERALRSDRARHGHDLDDAARVRPQRHGLRARRAARLIAPADAASVAPHAQPPGLGEHAARRVRDARTDPSRCCADSRPRSAARSARSCVVKRGLEVRQVRDEPRLARVVLEERGAVFLQQRPGLLEAAAAARSRPAP